MTPNLPTRFAIACKPYLKHILPVAFSIDYDFIGFPKLFFVASASGLELHGMPIEGLHLMPFLRSGAAKEAKQRKQRWKVRNRPERVKTNIVPTRLANLMDHVSNWNRRKWFNDSRYNGKPAHNRKPIQLRSTEVLFEINGLGNDITKHFFCVALDSSTKLIRNRSKKKFINCRQENSAAKKKPSVLRWFV